MSAKLYVDLVPETAWYNNLRAMLDRTEWDAVRREVYRRANYRCQICGGKGDKWPVEAHERWGFDEGHSVQELKDIEALCPACHEVTHFGFAQVCGRADAAFAHLMKVNQWSKEQALAHIHEMFDLWRQRSQRRWALDARLVYNFADLSQKTRDVIEQFALEVDRMRSAHTR